MTDMHNPFESTTRDWTRRHPLRRRAQGGGPVVSCPALRRPLEERPLAAWMWLSKARPLVLDDAHRALLQDPAD